MPKFILAFQALRELGPRQLGLFAWYRTLLRSGYYRRVNPVAKASAPGNFYGPLKQIPSRQQLSSILDKGIETLLGEADQAAAGQVRLFGAEPVTLRLSSPEPLRHWSDYERYPATFPGQVEGAGQDIKFAWEPARFGWVFTLGRAYCASGNENYAESFWRFAEQFLEANPPEWGIHWISGQEVALRILAFAFANQVFSGAAGTTRERSELLARAIGVHAARIPLTLSYARAQNNNHLLSEAVGLYTAACCLPEHPDAQRWSRLGWVWFNRGILSQVDEDGAYIQQSTNYQRMMLHLALWMDMLVRGRGQVFPAGVAQRLAAATRWLLALVDPDNGSTPNLGANDGANILPLSLSPFNDYRPVLQAAAQAFCGFRPFGHGVRDELALWLDTPKSKRARSIALEQTTPHILRADDGRSWAYLRAASFHARPGHADQLHLDLWFRGLNIAQDAGAYLYNASPPWENALTDSAVHNTITVNGQEQMRRAGRFLYLDWAQAQASAGERESDGSWRRLTVQHDGYRKLGVTHQRTVTVLDGENWLVEDTLKHSDASPDGGDPSFSVRLHWLLADYPWELDGSTLRLQSPQGQIQVKVSAAENAQRMQISLVRGGEWLVGPGAVEANRGWVSPTYGVRLPALSFSVVIAGPLPLRLSTEWLLPEPLPRTRAAALLIQDDKIAMIERYRAGKYYYVFPGGGVHQGETPEQAVVREAREELGLEVRVKRLVAQSTSGRDSSLYYAVEQESGQFGTGDGKELSRSANSERGSVKPVWVSLAKLHDRTVYPRFIAELVSQAVYSGWPEQPVHFTELGGD